MYCLWFRPAAGRRVMLKRDFPERSMALGQGPAAKRRDSSGAPGRFVWPQRHTACKFWLVFSKSNACLFYLYKPAWLTFSSRNVTFTCNLLVYCTRLWSRVVTTRTSQDRSRPSSRLDSEGEEEDDDTDKVISQFKGWKSIHVSPSWHYLFLLKLPLRIHN